MRVELLILLTLQAVAFMAFIVCAFTWLFSLRRKAVAKSGNTFPDFGATIEAFREGLKDPRYARLRGGMAGSVLVIMSAALLVPLFTQA